MSLPAGVKEITRELDIFDKGPVFPGTQKFVMGAEELKAYVDIYLKAHPEERLHGSPLKTTMSFRHSDDGRQTKLILKFYVARKDPEEEQDAPD